MNNKRLLTILDLIEDNLNIVDVGADHGYLSILIHKHKKNTTVTASDISSNALNYAIENIKKENLVDSISVKVSDGIKDINKDINAIVIAGMGTHTILNILNDGKNELKHIDTLYICSNNNEYLLRSSIVKLGYYIYNEKIVIDNNKTYIIIVFKKGLQNYSIEQLTFGPILLKKELQNNDYINYLNKQENILKLKVLHENDSYSKNMLEFLQKEIR